MVYIQMWDLCIYSFRLILQTVQLNVLLSHCAQSITQQSTAITVISVVIQSEGQEAILIIRVWESGESVSVVQLKVTHLGQGRLTVIPLSVGSE